MSLAQTISATSASVVALAALGLWGGLSHESQLFGPSLVSPPSPDQFALTFDDGPNPAATPYLLDTLARHNVRATFFVIGAYALREPAITRRIHAEGHVLGNHTMHHPWLPRHSNTLIREELRSANHAVADITGAPVRLFRPPHGARRPFLYRAARELDLQVVLWNVMVGDWLPRIADDLHARILAGMARNFRKRRGTNLVLHDGSQHSPATDRTATLQAVNLLLGAVKPGTRFVTPLQWS